MNLGKGKAPTWRTKEEILLKDFILPAGSIICPIEHRNLSKETRKYYNIKEERDLQIHKLCYTAKGMVLIHIDNIEEVKY